MIEIALLALFILSIGGGLTYLFHRILARLRALEGEIKTLTSTPAPRHSHRTCAGIEDALAVLIDESRLIDSAEFDLQAARSRLHKAHEILKIIRGGPQAYDPERPAGRKLGEEGKSAR